MKLRKTGVFVVAFDVFFSVACVAATAPPGSFAGNWSGESLCTIKDSPCHDEHVIYRVTEPNAAGKLKIQMDKVVDGQPEEMGTVDCTYDRSASNVTCSMNNGTWKFTVTGKKMDGILTLSNGRLYRRISVTRDES